MTMIWARTAGAWNGSIWDYWDGSQVTAYPYASPQNGDVVYLNGYNITFSGSVTINIGNGTISNLSYSDENITINAGGQIGTTGNSSFNITSNIESGGVSLFLTTGNYGSITVTGNISFGSAEVFHYSSYANNVTINGNVTSNGAGSITSFLSNVSNANMYFTLNGNITLRGGGVLLRSATSGRNAGYHINGNVDIEGSYLSIQPAPQNDGNVSFITGNVKTNYQLFANSLAIGLYIGGNFEGSGNYNIAPNLTSLQIDGIIRLYNGYHLFNVTNLTLGNQNQGTTIRYTGNGGYLLGFSNISTFTPANVICEDDAPFILVARNQFADYPVEDRVVAGVEYAFGQKVGTFAVDYPPESVVLNGYEYDNGNKTGSLSAQAQVGCVTKEDVREGVPLLGMGETGTLIVPSVDDVREGVVFDNGSVGTLIVQGGGERLRIADFGYYTRSTSITYIVDLTESDKPAFADCEEIVLRSLFPTLDLNNIPDKFFDDLLIQFLRYRLLVEYYRGISVNSKFTPSEPTTEIVNYANTKCEYWLNTANLFLQLWGEKYPNSVKKDRILL